MLFFSWGEYTSPRISKSHQQKTISSVSHLHRVGSSVRSSAGKVSPHARTRSRPLERDVSPCSRERAQVTGTSSRSHTALPSRVGWGQAQPTAPTQQARAPSHCCCQGPAGAAQTGQPTAATRRPAWRNGGDAVSPPPIAIPRSLSPSRG